MIDDNIKAHLKLLGLRNTFYRGETLNLFFTHMASIYNLCSNKFDVTIEDDDCLDCRQSKLVLSQKYEINVIYGTFEKKWEFHIYDYVNTSNFKLFYTMEELISHLENLADG